MSIVNNLSLSDLLAKCRVLEGTGTHTTVGSPGHKYNILDSHYEKFLKLYTKKIIDSGMDNETEIYTSQHIVERPIEKGPLVFDFDAKSKYPERQYTLDNVKKIIYVINNIIYETIGASGDYLMVLLMEKKKPSVDKQLYKDGFHLHYYNLILHTDVREYITVLSKKRLEEEAYLDCFNPENLHDIVDTRVVKSNGLMMYGSIKYLNGKKGALYYASGCFDEKGNRYDEYNNVEDIVKLTSMYRIKWVEEYSIAYSTMEIIHKYLENNNVSKSTMNKKENMPSTRGNVVVKKAIDPLPDELTLSHILACIDALPVHYSKDFETWTEIGWTLYNISDALYYVFDNFSKKADNYDQSGCIQLWNKAYKKDLTIGTLIYHAKKKEEEYTKCLTERLLKYRKNLKAEEHFEIAKFIDIFSDGNFKYDTTTSEWYVYNKKTGMWETEEKDSPSMQRFIADECTKRLTPFLQSRANLDPSSTADQILRDVAENGEQIKRVHALISQMRNSKYVDNLQRACRSRMTDKDIKKKLDNNPNIFAFNNGILYDLVKKEERRITPEDYLTINCGYPFKKLHNEKLKEIESTFEDKVLGRMFIGESREPYRSYMKKALAYCISGRIYQKVINCTGEGKNGKTALFETIMSKILGGYFLQTESDVFSCDRNNPNGADMLSMEFKAKRCIVGPELRANTIINAAYVKKLTGGERIKARNNYDKKMTEFMPQLKLFFTTNNTMQADDTSEGWNRRFTVVPFETRFVGSNDLKSDTIMKRYKNTAPVDIELMSRFDNDDYKLGMFMYFLKIYTNDIEANAFEIYEPLELIQHTKKYKKDSSNVVMFMNEWCEKGKDDDIYIPLIDLHKRYSDWVTKRRSKKEIKSQNEFKQELLEYDIGIDYKFENDKFYGLTFKGINAINLSKMN